MKHLNFLSKSGSQSRSHNIVTLCTTVGSPSAHRRGIMLKLISVLVLILTIGVGNVWGTLSSPYECTFTASLTESNNQVTTGDVTWTLSRTVGKGSPTTTFGNQNSQSCIKFGSGKNNYYSKMTLTTSAFSSYNVSSVVVYISSNNGGSKTVKVTQGSTTIGTGSQSFSSTTWVTNCTRNTTAGSGGDLSVEISSDATATYVHSIKVTYSAPSCTVKPTVGASLTSVSADANSITATVPISNIGGCNITENGLVYSASVQTPTIGTTGCTKVTTTACGATAANKEVTIENLDCGTTYYVRGYAINAAGTQYTINTTTQATSACPLYTVTLMDDSDTRTQATAGASVTLPERTGCTGYTFAGWTKSWNSAQTEWTTTAPTIIPAGSYTPTANENLYPVYTKTEGGGTTYQFQKVTALSQIKAGGTFIITNGSYYLPNGAATNAGPAVASMVTVTNGVVTGTVTDAMKWTFSAADANNRVTIKSVANSNNYLYSTSDNNGLRVSTTSDSWTFEEYTVSSVLGFAMKSTSNSRYCAVYSTSNWRSYTTKNHNNYSQNSGRLDLYKYTAVNNSTTSYISVPNCCTPLGSINGSFNQGQQKVTWGAVEDASGYKVRVEDANHQEVSDWTDNGSGLYYSTAGLTCGGATYYIYVKAYNNDNAGHCTGDGPASSAIQVTSAACTEPAITVDPNALTGLNYIVNAGPSAAQSFNVKGSNLTGALTIKANDNYEICLTNSATAADWKSGATTLSIAKATAEANAGQNVYVRLKSGKAVGDYNSNTIKVYGGGIEEASAATVTVSGSVLQPTLSASPNSIAFGEVASTSSASQDVAVTMTNITGNVTASLTGTDAAKFSIDKNSLSSSGTITVSKNSTAVGGPYSATLSLSAAGVSTVEIPISMTLIEIPTYTLKALNLIEEGDEVIIVGNNGDSYAMSNNNGTSSAPAAVAVTITNDAITNPANTIIWEVSPSDDGYTFYPKGSTTNWLYCTNANNGVRVGSNDNKLFTLDESGYLKNSGTSRYVGIYNSQDWRCYTSNDGNIAGQTFSFYVKESTTPKVSISGTMNAFSYMRDNGPSAAQTFSVRGNKLTADLVVNAPESFEICATENGTYVGSLNLTPENKTVSETTLYIRLKSGLAINSYNGNITVSSTGATNATKAVTGSVTTPIYTVTLHTNGGTINADYVTSYTEGEGATLPTNVTKDGYSFGGWYANSDLETGGVQTTIATNATGAKEYWAKWNELPGYDITWLVDGEAYTVGTPSIRVTSGGSIMILPSTPTSLDITSKTFVGWTTAPVNEKQANAPSPLYTTADEIPGNITENKIFYAVFAQETHSGTFTKVTDASTLAAGDRLLFVNESNSKAAGAFGAGAYLTSQNVTISNSTISSQGDAVVYVLGGSVDAWTFTSGEGTLGCTGTGNASLSTSGGTTTWKITITSGTPTIKPTDLVTYLKYNSSSPRFTTYASGQSAVQLYREGTSLNDYTTKFVKPVAVTGVSLNKDATTLAIGGTETLTATVAPANATNKNVSWSSNATGVATVAAGVVTAVSAGEATITVTTEDGSFTDECVVTVLPTVETPTFSPAAGAINKGSKVEILCGTAEATILYSIDGSDPSLAYPDGGVTINANCTLKAKATKANYTTSAVAQAAYTIIKAEQTVSFAESAISFRLNSTEYTAFTGQTASSTYGSASITYASSNTSVAEVDENTGAVTLKGVKGTTTITATAAEDDDYQSASATYTISVLRAGVVRTGDFTLVTDASQLADGDYILLTSETRNGYGDPNYAYVFNGISGSQGNAQTKNVVNDEITYAQLLEEGNTAKIIYLEKEVVGNVDYWKFNYGSDDDIYIAAGTSTSSGAAALRGLEEIDDYCKWTISIGEGNVANVNNKGNTTYCALSYNTQGSGAFKSYKSLQTGSLRIYKQKDKNKLPQTLSFATASYEFPLNESAYTSFAHQTVSGAHTEVTYTTSNSAVAAINNNTVVLNGGVGTATITATAAESEDYEHASATYTITVTAALNTVTFHYYNAADASAAQTALKEETSGAGITVPAKPADVGEYTFIGWAPATLEETLTTPTNLVAALQAGAIRHPNTNEDYYAIYRRLENSDGRFYLMHEVNSTPNYAKAPAGSDTKSFSNTTNIAEAAVFVQTSSNKLYYDNSGTSRYFSSTNTTARDLDFTTNADDALTWEITENGLTTEFYSSNSQKYLAHNGIYWAAYGTGSINQANQSKDLTKVYLADVYYSSTPNLMVSPVLTWAQGNATHVMEIEDTYDNAATATVNDVPVSVTYTSSDPSKATVSAAGVVTAILGGDVTITATVAAQTGVSRALVESYDITITKKVPQITFAASTEADYKYKVFVGEAYKKDLSENVTIVSDGAVSYSLSNNATSSEYASINASTGVVTGLSSNGSAIQYMFVRTAETDMYQPGEANHIFYVLSLKNQALAFDQNAYVFDMNESVDVFTNTLSGVQTSATFASNNTDVAEVDAASGEVTVHTNVCGTATITATAAEGQVGDEVYKEVSQAYTITVNYPKPTFSMESSNIKAPVSLTISGYDENTKLFWTDGEGDPNTPYSEPLAIDDTKTIRAKATNADGSLVSPIASVKLTKVTPTVVGSQEGGTITLSSDEGALITYIILNQNAVTVAEGENVASPVVFESEMSGTFTVEATATWDVENGFTGEAYDNDFVIKGKGHLPINYTGNGSGLADEAWASVEGSIGSNNSDPKIKFGAQGISIIASFVEKPVQLSYDIKHNQKDNDHLWNAVNNEYKVQWSADGNTYHDIVVYTSSNPITTTIMSPTFDLDPSARYIKWTYVAKDNDGGNVALGNIRITCEAVVIDGVSVVDIPEGYDGDVVVENGVTWEPKENDVTEINNLLIKQGAIVDLTDAMLIVNDVMLESMEGYSGQILEPDNFEAQGQAYYDLTLNTSGTMDNRKWYAFAVPFQVDAATGIQRLSNDGVASNAGFNSHYVLLKYNSEAYASSAQGWEYVTRGETLMPGKFYMIALNSNAYNRVRMTKKADTPLNNKADLTLETVGTGMHANWNALANNALAYANVSATGGNAGLYVQVYNSATDNYTAYEYGKITFTVGTPFFIQVVEAGTMSVEIADTNNEHVKAPAREAEATGVFQIRLGENTESYYDILYVSASDEALNEYQIGHDLVKAGVSTTVPQLYVPAYGGKLCKAEFPLANNEATFPLTFTAPSAGTYQLYIAEAAADAELYLQKDGATIWNLTMGAYPLELPQGTTENYGLLLKAKAPGSATGVDEVQSDKVQCTKVVIDDHVYILRGGQIYDVTGKAVK